MACGAECIEFCKCNAFGISHIFQVTVAKFSAFGRYIVTMDDVLLKIWQWSSRVERCCGSVSDIAGNEYVEMYEMPESSKTANSL